MLYCRGDKVLFKNHRFDGVYHSTNELSQFFRTMKQMEHVAEHYTNVFRFVSYTLILLLLCYLIACLQQGFMCFT